MSKESEQRETGLGILGDDLGLLGSSPRQSVVEDDVALRDRKVLQRWRHMSLTARTRLEDRQAPAHEDDVPDAGTTYEPVQRV